MDTVTDTQSRGIVAGKLSVIRKLGILSLLYLAVFLTRIGFGTILILFPVYIEVPFGEEFLAGLILAMYPLTEAVSAMPIGAVVDRRGRRRAFLVGMILITVLTIVLGLARNVLPPGPPPPPTSPDAAAWNEAVIIFDAIVGSAHAIMGLSAALITVSSLTMITDLTVVENRGAGMGAFDLSNLAGYGVGVIIGALFHGLNPNNLGPAFLFVGAIFTVATVATVFLLKEPPHVSTERQSISQMIKANLGSELNTILPLWFSLTVVLGFYFFLPRLTKSANAENAISQSTLLILIALISLGFGALFFGRLSDKIGRWRTMVIGVVGEVGFLLTFPQFFDRLLESANSGSLGAAAATVGPIGVIAGVFFFLGTALVPSMLAYIGDKAHQEIRGSAMGIYSFMLSLGTGVGNILAGVLAQLGGVPAVFYFGAILFSTMALVTGLLRRRRNNLTRAQERLDRHEPKPAGDENPGGDSSSSPMPSISPDAP